MGNREYCPNHGMWDYEKLFRAYIRKYDYNRKAKWIPKGWICEKCDTFVSDKELKKKRQS